MSMDVNADIMKAIEDARDQENLKKENERLRQDILELNNGLKTLYEDDCHRIYVIYYPEVELYEGDHGFVNDINDATKYASKKAAELANKFKRFEKRCYLNSEIIFYGWRKRNVYNN